MGDSPGDLLFAIVETADEVLLFPDYTGFAGRVNFERQAFWAERGCVFWVSERHATLPAGCAAATGCCAAPGYARVPRAELAGLLDGWPLDGPQTWGAQVAAHREQPAVLELGAGAVERLNRKKNPARGRVCLRS